jgi:hypothetical protein
VVLYKQIVDKAPSSPNAARAKERIAQSAGGAAPAPAPAPPSGGSRGSSRVAEGAVPDDFVAPQPGAHVDTSDLPGSKSPKPSGDSQSPPPSNGPPPGIDTSDLPGLK